jgi:hypothetical protein
LHRCIGSSNLLFLGKKLKNEIFQIIFVQGKNFRAKKAGQKKIKKKFMKYGFLPIF